MTELSCGDGRRVRVCASAPDSEIALGFEGAPYAAVIWACEPFEPRLRTEIANRLVFSGCCYIVCGGVDCKEWHDDADVAIMRMEASSPTSTDSATVMTTWHWGKSEVGVLWYAFNCTFDPTTTGQSTEDGLLNLLILVASCDSATLGRLEALVKRASEPTADSSLRSE